MARSSGSNSSPEARRLGSAVAARDSAGLVLLDTFWSARRAPALVDLIVDTCHDVDWRSGASPACSLGTVCFLVMSCLMHLKDNPVEM